MGAVEEVLGGVGELGVGIGGVLLIVRLLLLGGVIASVSKPCAVLRHAEPLPSTLRLRSIAYLSEHRSPRLRPECIRCPHTHLTLPTTHSQCYTVNWNSNVIVSSIARSWFLLKAICYAIIVWDKFKLEVGIRVGMEIS